MQNDQIDELDVVALVDDAPEFGLRRGQVGTVVMAHSTASFEVEFTDDSGVTYALATLPAAQLIKLRYAPASVA